MARASPCVSVATESDSSEAENVASGTLPHNRDSVAGLASCAVDTESESEVSGAERPEAVPEKRTQEQVTCPMEEVETEAESETPDSAERPSGRMRCKRQRCAPSVSSASRAPDRQLAMESSPASSGCSEYVMWIVSERLSASTLDTLCRKSPLRLGSMCSGMATEELALAALHEALLARSLPSLPHVSVFKRESDPKKVNFLRRHLPPDTLIFPSNGSLADAMPETVEGKFVQRPLCDVLVCGLVCKDISGLSRTPGSINGAGKSGQALQGLLSALRNLSFEERPRMVNLECVSRLASSRHVEKDNIPGTESVSLELRKLGYVGKWFGVKTQKFFLPQSRARVYSIHLKLADLAEESVPRRKADLEVASEILSRLQTSEAESLEVVLGKLPQAPAPAPRSRGSRGRPEDKWPASHAAFVDKHGLSLEERKPPSDFVKAIEPWTSARGLEAMWLKVALWSRKTSKDWRHHLLILPHGHSVTFATVQSRLFPCVTPTHDHVVLKGERAHRAGAYVALALQGIQDKEVRRWRLHEEDEALLRDLAGNAFTANTIAAVLIAGISVV